MTPQLCQHCKRREATKIWVGDGGALALVHGGGQSWCEQCVLEAQVKHCQQAAERLPSLQQRLAEIAVPPSPADGETPA